MMALQPGSLAMTTVLITGANRGIGLEFVRQYAADGADVIACCRTPARAEALKALADQHPGKVRLLALDVGDAAQIERLKGELAGQPIDILINNAGVYGPSDVDPEAWLETFRVNAIAPMLIARALHDNLRRGREKKLVAITSQLGSTANNGGGMVAYRSSKAALNNAMRGLSRDWAGEGITVGIFHPGWVKTDMGGANAPVTPAQSVTGLRRRIAELGRANSGAYRDYAGAELPW
jgi:NAD(P)-dependent dehydrogenase (short-subunit alcohol dehydrogenase family)